MGLQDFIEFVTIFLLLYVWFSGHEAHGILASQPGIKPAPPALDGDEVLTFGPPGKSPRVYMSKAIIFCRIARQEPEMA